MTFARGIQTRLAIGTQADFSTDAAAMATIPYVSHSLDITKERLSGDTVSTDRLSRIDYHGSRQVAGEIVVEMRSIDFDPLLESALLSTFTTSGVLSHGATEQFLTVEDGALDISQYRKFQSCVVNSMAISAQPNSFVLGTFDVIGKDMVQGTSQLAAPAAVSSGGGSWDVFSGAIYEGGTATGDMLAIVSSLDFTLSNSYAPVFDLTSASASRFEYSRSVLEGQLVVYYEDATLINKFLNETESSLQITFDDRVSGSAYTFDMPRIKLNGAAVPVGDVKSRFITLPFVALADDNGVQLEISKS